MWHNVLILLLYFILFHLLLRTNDLCNELFGMANGKSFVYPAFSLNAKQLRAILNHRGVSYTGIVEKPELSKLADLSGRVTEFDLEDAYANGETFETTHNSNTLSTEHVKREVQDFTGSVHFFEQVEDSKDSAWIVQIIVRNGFPVVSDVVWHQLILKLSRFGIRFGILHCERDTKLCHQRNWNTSRLLLALPTAHLAKSNVVQYTYTSSNYRTQSLIDWVFGLMKQKVPHLNTSTDVSRWLGESCAADVCLLLVSSLTLPPFFLSSLSVKFTGRVKFGSCSSRSLRRSAVAQRLSITSNSSDSVETNATSNSSDEDDYNGNSVESRTGQYLMIANGASRHVRYGELRRERLSFSTFQTYLKWLAPDVNDVFVTSMAFVNVLAVMSLWDMRGSPMQRVLHFSITLVKYNSFLLLSWFAILGVLNWKSTLTICRFLMYALRNVTMSEFGRRMIAEWNYATSRYFMTFGFLFVVYNSIICSLRRRFFPSTFVQPESWSEWLRSANSTSASASMAFPQIPMFGSRNFYDNNSVNALSETLDPRLAQLVSQWAIPQVYMQPTTSYAYILDLPALYFCELQQNEIFEKSYSQNEKLCFRCLCVETLKLNTLKKKLKRRPCFKCGYSGESSRNCGNRLASVCPICLELFSVVDYVSVLPCEHVYHQRCILSWLLRDQPSCPCCRWPANERKEKDV